MTKLEIWLPAKTYSASCEVTSLEIILPTEFDPTTSIVGAVVALPFSAKALIGSRVKIITATNAKHKIRFFMLHPFLSINSII